MIPSCLKAAAVPGVLLLPVLFLTMVLSPDALGAEYHVGPGQASPSIGDVPWATLSAGDTVLIHWRSTPYAEKWVICRQGTAASPITVRGISGSGGQRPVVTGDGAVTPSLLNYWNEDRGVIKIGGANTPADTTPEYIVVENLEIRSARPAFAYTGDDAASHTYASNAAAVHIEKGRHITIRNCVLHDCGNGLFCAHQTEDLTVEGCTIHGNGIESSIYEHNNYTEAKGIIFQYNRFGPLRTNCPGNNLKDRSAGTVVRYNWIEGGNRQLDLVDSGSLNTEPAYAETRVYGNVLIEPDGAGNSQIVHYGGDSGSTAQYRKGTLYFFNNTVVSTRSGNTTLFRLSTNDETADCRNNILYVTAGGDCLALLNSAGILNLAHNWFKAGWVNSHGTLTGTLNNNGGHVLGTDPGFVDEAGQDFMLAESSGCIDQGTSLPGGTLLPNQYWKHCTFHSRWLDEVIDIGAFEYAPPQPPPHEPEVRSCGLLGFEALLALVLTAWIRRKSRHNRPSRGIKQ